MGRAPQLATVNGRAKPMPLWPMFVRSPIGDEIAALDVFVLKASAGLTLHQPQARGRDSHIHAAFHRLFSFLP